MKRTLLLLVALTAVHAETVRLTLRQAIDQALNQNPELVMARLDQQKAEMQVRVNRDPFSPKVVVGSGAAYSTGYPQSIDGNPPSIFQAKTIMALYNAQRSPWLPQSRENARTAALDENAKRDDIGYRTASLFLDIRRTAQSLDLARKQVDSFAKVLDVIQARVNEGKEFPLSAKQAQLNLSRAKQRVEALQMDTDYGEASLAIVLGMTATDRVQPVEGDNAIPAPPATEDAAVEQALTNSRGDPPPRVTTLSPRLSRRSHTGRQSAPVRHLVAQYLCWPRTFPGLLPHLSTR